MHRVRQIWPERQLCHSKKSQSILTVWYRSSENCYEYDPWQ